MDGSIDVLVLILLDYESSNSLENQ